MAEKNRKTIRSALLNCKKGVKIKSHLRVVAFFSTQEPTFDGCNLSMVKTVKTAFKEVKFNNCKLLGVRFENCSEFLFQVYFENCVLNLASFYKLNLKKTTFKHTSLHEVDFTEADLTGAIFDNCDLERAIFENTVLEKADFRTAYNYSIDPSINKIKKAKFSLAGVAGLLDKFDIEIH